MKNNIYNNKLTQKQENFCLNLFSGMSQYDAYLAAGYSSKQSRAVIDINACNLAKDNKIIIRVAELRAHRVTAEIATVDERKKKLTEILRADATEFIDAQGNITLEGKRTAAIAEINVDVINDVIQRRKIKLLNPIQAIQELNKMEHIYTEGVNIGNLVFQVVYEDEKQGT